MSFEPRRQARAPRPGRTVVAGGEGDGRGGTSDVSPDSAGSRCLAGGPVVGGAGVGSRGAAELPVDREWPGRRHEPSRRRGRRPRGRIAYAVVGRFDEAFGPIGTQLYAVDPDGSDRVLLLDCDVIRPQWSPDGSRLALTIGLDDGSWQVATIAADGSDLRLLTSGPGIHEIPSWSPDGTWLAYDSSDVGLDDPTFQATLWRIDADGSDAAPAR